MFIIHFQAVAVESEGQLLILNHKGDTWPFPSAEAHISKIHSFLLTTFVCPFEGILAIL
jgi:hypothetical protein